MLVSIIRNYLLYMWPYKSLFQFFYITKKMLDPNIRIPFLFLCHPREKNKNQSLQLPLISVFSHGNLDNKPNRGSKACDRLYLIRNSMSSPLATVLCYTYGIKYFSSIETNSSILYIALMTHEHLRCFCRGKCYGKSKKEIEMIKQRLYII